VRVGRALDNDIVIPDDRVSRHHLEFQKFGDIWRVRDLGSGNGTELNGQPVQTADARAGDVIRVGSTMLRVSAQGVGVLGDPSSIASTPTTLLRHDAGGGARYMPGDVVNGHRLSVDGTRWDPMPPPGPSHHEAPTVEAMATRESGEPRLQAPVDNSLVWLLACSPLLYLLVDAALGATAPGAAAPLGVLIAWTVNSILVILDYRRLPSVGRPSVWSGLLFVPWYLFRRSSRLGQTLAIPVVWCTAAVASVALPLAAGVATFVDAPAVEQSIESGIRDQAGFSVTADCPPGIPANPGSTFQCTIEDEFGVTAIADVTIQNATGNFVWEVRR
jgi:hypothetical protein